LGGSHGGSGHSHSLPRRQGRPRSWCARNTAGATQVDKLLFNGAGYHNNIAQKLMLKVV
jgi:hypothetical protein